MNDDPPIAPKRRAGRRRGASTLYHEVFVHLRHLLTEGAVDPAKPLPSEPALAAQFGVSRVTVRKTLQQLEAEGLIERRRGIGTFPAVALNQDSKRNISGLLENLISYEQSTTAVNLVWERREMAGDVARFMGPGPHLYIVRVRSYLGQPISLTTLCVPERLASLLDPSRVADEPIIVGLERAGVIAERAEQVITAVPADGLAAETLGVGLSTPLIAMRRRMTDAAREPVLHQESLYAPDRFEYRMSLTRTSLGPAARWTPTG